MRRTSEKEIQAVLRLDGTARFRHFVKRVADSEMAWGMWKDGWALMANSDGTEVFPLWPAREYAELHRSGDWADYEVREIALVDLIDELVPKLAQHGVLPGVFPTPTGTGVTLSPEEFAAAIRTELENYE
jgi:hypothetical protein